MDKFDYERNEIISKILSQDCNFQFEIMEYLRKIQYSMVLKNSDMLHFDDIESISEDVAMTIFSEYPRTKEDTSFEAFIRMIYKRNTIDYISGKTGITRNSYRIISEVKDISEKYNIPIEIQNYYKFHRLTGYSIQSITKAFECYERYQAEEFHVSIDELYKI